MSAYSRMLMIFLFAGFLGCSCLQQASQSTHAMNISKVDTSQYELVIFDTGFDLWYELHYSPGKDRSNEAYHMYNYRAVLNWNQYYTSGKYSQYIGSYINYENHLDYGIEVNRKLYWYFKYVEESSGLKLFN